MDIIGIGVWRLLGPPLISPTSHNFTLLALILFIPGCCFQIFDLRIFSRARIAPFQPFPQRRYLAARVSLFFAIMSLPIFTGPWLCLGNGGPLMANKRAMPSTLQSTTISIRSATYTRETISSSIEPPLSLSGVNY